MKKLALISFLTLSLLMLFGCMDEPNESSLPPESSQSSVSQENSEVPPSPAPESSEAAKTSEPAEVKIAFAEGDETAAEEFTEEEFKDSPFLVKLAFSADSDIKNVQFLDVTLSPDGSFTVNKPLYTLESLPENDILLIGTTFPGDTPSRGISYEDMDGTAHRLLIFLSGMDGSLLTEEF